MGHDTRHTVTLPTLRVGLLGFGYASRTIHVQLVACGAALVNPTQNPRRIGDTAIWRGIGESNNCDVF